MAFLLFPEIQNVILRNCGNVEIGAAAEELGKFIIIWSCRSAVLWLLDLRFCFANRVKLRHAVFLKAVRPRAPKAFGVYVAASLGFEPRKTSSRGFS